jgi:hypothetical protein
LASGSKLSEPLKFTVRGAVPETGEAAAYAIGGALPPGAPVYRMRRTSPAVIAA